MSSASIEISRIITFLYNPIQHKCLYRIASLMRFISLHGDEMDNLKVIKGYGVTLYNLFNLAPGGSFSMNDKQNQ